jgi:hydroxymethylbilane synthase
MTLTLRIGTRPSRLAIAQATLVRNLLAQRLKGAEVELIPIRTAGDATSRGLPAAGGVKGLFVKELEQALHDRAIDLAVHSMKDLPAALYQEFRVVAVPAREDARDTLVLGRATSLEGLPAGARVGTASPRRRLALLRLRPDLDVSEVRGNVDTRLARLAAGEFDALALALAGLKRLGLARGLRLNPLDPQEVVPCGGQGALAIEALARQPVAGSTAVEEAVAGLADPGAVLETGAERSLLAALGAGCTTPLGVYARFDGRTLAMRAMLFSLDGRQTLADRLDEPALQPSLAPAGNFAEAAGRRLAQRMLARGAAALMEPA